MNADVILEWGLSNAAVASVLAVIAWAATRAARRPVVSHVLWLLVLVKLLTPPLVRVELPVLAPEEPSAPSEPATPPSAATPAAAVVEAPVGEALVAPPEPFAPVDIEALEAALSSAPTLRRDAEAPSAGARPGAVDVPRAADSDVSAVAVSAAGAPAIVAAPPGALAELAPERTPPLSAALWIVAVWLGGAAIWLLVLGARVAAFRRVLRRTSEAPAALRDVVADVASRVGLERAPRVVVLAGRVSPFVWSVGSRPVLVLPKALLASLSESERDTLIAHELAHLVRRDHWTRGLEGVALALYWWLPVVWWARRELHDAEDACCDARVERAYPERVRDYAAALFSTIEFLASDPPALPAGASGIGRVPRLRRRFDMILTGSADRPVPALWRIALVVVACAVVPFVPGLGARGQTPREHLLDDIPRDIVEEVVSRPDAAKTLTDDLLSDTPKDDARSTKKPDILHIIPLEDLPCELVLTETTVTAREKDSAHEHWTTKVPGGVGKLLFVRQTDDLTLTLRCEVPGEKKPVSRTFDLRDGRILDADGSTKPKPKPEPLDPLGVPSEKDVQPPKDTAPPKKPAPAPRLEALSITSDVGGAAPTMPSLDFVRLAEAVVEASGEQRLARSRLERTKRLADAAGVPAGDVEAAEIAYVTAEAKVELFRRMAEAGLRGAKRELEYAQVLRKLAEQRFASGRASSDVVATADLRLARAEMSMQILESILGASR